MNGNESKVNRSDKPANKKQHTTGKRNGLRITLRVLRPFLVPFLCLSALLAGLLIGYVYIGGRSAADVWEWDTWKHLFDLVFAK